MKEKANIIWITLFTLTLISGCTEKQNQNCGKLPCTTAEIINVIDGDTIEVKEKEQTTKIRLALVNTPEKNEIGYEEAKKFTKENCPIGTKAIIDIDEKQLQGSYGRTIALVKCCKETTEKECEKKPSLNQQLIEKNHAKIIKTYCNKSEFSNQEWAKNNGC